MDDLSKRFEERLRAAGRESEEAVHYRPAEIYRMLDTHGAVKTARLLTSKPYLQGGMRMMAKHDRLDLTIESIMLEPQFWSLFTLKERAKARDRLHDARKLVAAPRKELPEK